MKATIAVALLAITLSGCTSNSERIEQFGKVAFDKLEASSALGLKGCRRYTCKTARIGAVYDEFATPDERAGWAAICATKATNPVLPE